MSKQKIETTKAPAAIGPYSQGIIAGDLVFLSGQIPIDPKDGLLPMGIKAQTNQVFMNITAILNENKMTLNDVVKTTVFLKNLSDFAVMNEIYASYFKPPYPSRSTIEVAALPKSALIEIECIALNNNK